MRATGSARATIPATASGLGQRLRRAATACNAEVRRPNCGPPAHARVGPRSPADSVDPERLRVAELAGAGRSNPHIAATLHVSIRTVEFHLSGAYRKLGVRSRRELPAALVPNDVATP